MTARTWVDGPTGGTPLNATALNGMESDIASAVSSAAASATSAANSASLVGAPADTAIATAIQGTSTQTAAALNAAYAHRLPVLAPVQFIAPVTMATPPTVGALATATAITSAKTWRSVTGVSGGAVVPGLFAYPGCGVMSVYGTAYPDYLYAKFRHRTSSNEASAPWKADFVFDGTTLEVLFKGVTGMIRVRVDGQYVTETPTVIGNTGSTYFLPVTFSTRAVRIISVEGQGTVWGGVVTGPLDTIMPAPVRKPRVVLVGDSYTEGNVNGGTNGIQSWGRLFGDLMGWPDTYNSGVGGTGYLNPGASPRVKFRDRITNDVINLNPDIVLVCGGHNDTTTQNAAFTTAALQTEALAYFQALRAGLPNAIIGVVGPFAAGSQVATYPAYQTAIFNAAAGIANFTIDTMTNPVFTGTGNTGLLKGDGNSDLDIYTDGTHPTLAGHYWLARFMAQQVSAALAA